MPDIITQDHFDDYGTLKNMIAVYREAEDLINIGAYKKGANPEIDRSVKLHPGIQSFLKQGVDDSYTFDETLEMIKEIASG
jgi:flagellum-specific ATP synthase